MSSSGVTESVPIIIDNGSGIIKSGFAGNDHPSAVFPTIIGRRRHAAAILETNQQDQYIGKRALVNKDVLTIHYPIEHGIVADWHGMEKIWHHTFYNELHAAPEEHPLLITDSSLNPKGNREKMTEVLFERFSTHGNHSLSFENALDRERLLFSSVRGEPSSALLLREWQRKWCYS